MIVEFCAAADDRNYQSLLGATECALSTYVEVVAGPASAVATDVRFRRISASGSVIHDKTIAVEGDGLRVSAADGDVLRRSRHCLSRHAEPRLHGASGLRHRGRGRERGHVHGRVAGHAGARLLGGEPLDAALGPCDTPTRHVALPQSLRTAGSIGWRRACRKYGHSRSIGE